MKRIMVSTRLEEHMFEALQELAQREEQKVAFLVRKAVEQFVAQQQRKGRQAA